MKVNCTPEDKLNCMFCILKLVAKLNTLESTDEHDYRNNFLATIMR